MESNYYKKYLKYKHKYALLKNKLYEQLGAGPEKRPLPDIPSGKGEKGFVPQKAPILLDPKPVLRASPPQKPQEPQYVEMQNINSPRVGPGGVYKPK